ncbi:uncharacterized protein Ndc80 [Hetaerina americana]|uniref:uncharacterized protein Ndc80 n=1 Tax=Hetaerina americana TaxID=62018 RepID=UPI003A7F3319
MDPITKIRKRFSQGRRSSVDPIRYPAEDYSLMATEEKRPRSGIPRIVTQVSSKRRSSSLDRTRSVSKMGYDNNLGACSTAGLLFTPQNPVTPRVSLSARKAIECISQLSAKCQAARKEQRIALDKNAQIRLSRHVATYLNKTGLVGDLLAGGHGRAPTGLIQSSDLKNMNKGLFIALFNLLFRKCGSRRKVDFNSSNYHDSLPMIAKKLGYPGVIYKSHLLTPSTPHSWPYIIAFLGWLVDLVIWLEPFEVALESIPDTDTMAVMEFYLKSYAAYLNEETEEPLEEHVQEFKTRIYVTRNTEPELIEDLTRRRDQLKAILDADQGSFNHLKEQAEKDNAEIQELISEIESLGTYNSSRRSETERITSEINEEVKRREILVSKIEEQKKEKELLKVICSKQDFTKPQWDQMVAENKETQEGNQMLVEMCEQTKKIVDSLDVKISAIRNKLHKVWFEITEASMSIQADSPQVTHLLKLVQNFSHLAPDAQVCFEEILTTLEHALTEITSKVMQDQAKAKTLQDKIHGVSIEANLIRRNKEQLMREMESLQSERQLAVSKFKEEEEQLSRKVDGVMLQVKCILDVTNGDSNVELENVKKRYKEKLDELEVTKEGYASCLGDMQKMAESYLKIALEKLAKFQDDVGRLSMEVYRFTEDVK